MTSVAAPGNRTRVPLVDLGIQQREVAADVRAGFEGVLAASCFVGGPEVVAFEAAYADFADVRHCIGVGNGTDALEMALRAIGVGPGDEVVLPANTFAATAEAVVRSGARPVLADVDPNFLLMDPESAAAVVGARTRALLPVHLFGQVAPMESLAVVAAACGAVLIEDAAQAQGATRSGRPAGGFGVAAGTSFYPGKNLGAYGDAGAILTNDDAIAACLRRLRNHGGENRYEHELVGLNSRLDSLQAVVLAAKLRRLPAWNEQRRAAARLYDELLSGVAGVTLPATAPGNEHCWHLYVIRTSERDAVLQRLHSEGIGAGVHYPAPIHLLPAFRYLGHRTGDFPVAERAASQILSLPIFPGITPLQQETVVAALGRALEKAA